jgi:hydroxymethylglutaryl-CoA synthase
LEKIRQEKNMQLQESYTTTVAIGIDDMSLYVPKIYFDIKDLAEIRDLEYPKLNKGLGLSKMAILDVHEDTATMAANAVADLIDKNNLHPSTVGRLYLGTESALDGSKPTATYILEMLRNKYKGKYGEDCFLNCDVVDLTFACVGGVDAMQNTIDWVAGGKDRIGIVVASDNAKYELGSSGEYTQGAGAVAILIKRNPRLIAFDATWGVATLGVHDFYKPKRTATKAQIIQEVLELAAIQNGSVEKYLDRLPNSLDVNGVLDSNDEKVTIHKDTPVFDGQFSNQCYQDRIGEAFEHFKKQKISKGELETENKNLLDEWEQLIFHLPYAFHGKRIFSDIFAKEVKKSGQWDAIRADLGLDEPQLENFECRKDYDKAYALFLRGVSQTPQYKSFVKQKIEKGQRASSLVGNMYTCSIFLALMSVLEVEWLGNQDLTDKKLGFFAYGSGSKSKVFQGTVQPTWKTIVERFHMFDILEQRQPIEKDIYHNLHIGRMKNSFLTPQNEFVLAEIGESGVTEGARYYDWVS